MTPTNTTQKYTYTRHSGRVKGQPAQNIFPLAKEGVPLSKGNVLDRDPLPQKCINNRTKAHAFIIE